MYTPKQMFKYVYPFRFTCSDCKRTYRIDRIGVAVGGNVVVIVECGICEYSSVFYLDYDNLLFESQASLIKELRSESQPTGNQEA